MGRQRSTRTYLRGIPALVDEHVLHIWWGDIVQRGYLWLGHQLCGYDPTVRRSTRTFSGAIVVPVADISKMAGNTSSVTSMWSMFYKTTSFNADISAWDTSSVTTMGGMFRDATAFNAEISAWDTSSVTSMMSMFDQATAFNADISAWNTSSVTTMGGMFGGAHRLTRTSLSGIRAR